MAIKKATTTEDFTETATDEVAVSAPEGYTVLVGPSGTETKVPDSILEALLDSGYVKK